MGAFYRDDADHSYLSAVGVKNDWSYNFIHAYAFMACTRKLYALLA